MIGVTAGGRTGRGAPSLGLAVCGFLLAAGAASAQSRDTLTGMDAYNRGDIGTAYRLLAGEARKGDAEAEVNLGYLYARGQGVAVNQMTAFHLYSLSAAQGDSEGTNALGYKYEFGTGVARDIAMAVHWYCKAVEAGNPRAMNNLALVLNAGADVPRDLDQARDLWRQSAALGHINAMVNLAFSDLEGTRAELDRKEAALWMRRAAEGGQANAQAFVRANGDTGPLPSPVNQAAEMIPSVRGASGHARICGDFIS